MTSRCLWNKIPLDILKIIFLYVNDTKNIASLYLIDKRSFELCKTIEKIWLYRFSELFRTHRNEYFARYRLLPNGSRHGYSYEARLLQGDSKIIEQGMYLKGKKDGLFRTKKTFPDNHNVLMDEKYENGNLLYSNITSQ